MRRGQHIWQEIIMNKEESGKRENNGFETRQDLEKL